MVISLVENKKFLQMLVENSHEELYMSSRWWKCRVYDSLRGYFQQSYQDSSSERVIDGTNSTISEEDSNLDEKNKRHSTLLATLCG